MSDLEHRNPLDAITDKRLSRRQFLRVSGAAGLGLVAVGALPGSVLTAGAVTDVAQQAGGNPAYPPRTNSTEVDAYLKVGADGTITLYSSKLEFGQGIQTGFGQLAAEELDVPFEAVNVVMGVTDQVPYDAGTFNSASTRGTGPTIRQAAAEMRQWLRELAAQQWGLAADQVHTANGKVVAEDGSGRTAAYADLAAGKATGLSTKGDAPLKDPSTFTIVGQSIPRVDVPDKVNGTMKYGYDATVPGMVHGKVVRAPSIGATLTSIDFSAAQNMPGVVGVVHDGDFAGLAAERHEQAEAALAAVQATWQETSSPYTSENLFDGLKSTADAGAPIGTQHGDVDGALANAAQKVHVTVRAPYVAHAPIEPMTALVSIQPDKTEVWTSTQIQFEAQDAVASTLGIPRDQVIVYPLMSGGAYGRKDVKDAVIEAARLAKGIGRPVRINWNRQEDFRFEYARPAMVVELTAALDGQAKLSAWDWASYAAAYPEPGSGIGFDAAYYGPPAGYGATAYPGPSKPMASGATFAATVLDYYQIPNVRAIGYQSVSPLGVTFWRDNGAPINTLAREAAIDQLAELAGMDPVSFRDSLMQNNPRFAAVMHAAVEKSGWKPGAGSTGQGFGLGLNFTDNTYVAEVAHVSVDPNTGKVRANKIWAAVDAGLLVNPMAARHQIEGSIVSQGTSSTLNEQILFAHGRVTNDSFERYAPIGFLDAPAVDVTFIEDKSQPMAGIGEPGVGAVSAAISNAIYDAVGVRMLDLPFLPDKVLAALSAGNT